MAVQEETLSKSPPWVSTFGSVKWGGHYYSPGLGLGLWRLDKRKDLSNAEVHRVSTYGGPHLCQVLLLSYLSPCSYLALTQLGKRSIV